MPIALVPGARVRKRCPSLRVTGGLLIAGGIFAVLVLPRMTECFCGSRQLVAEATVEKYAYEAYSRWRMQTGELCPRDLTALDPYMNNKDTRDPWGVEYQMTCRVFPRLTFVVVSAGEDGRFATDDDVRSDLERALRHRDGR